LAIKAGSSLGWVAALDREIQNRSETLPHIVTTESVGSGTVSNCTSTNAFGFDTLDHAFV
jgi:hypothetical protein